jgi:hypothetical protein
MTAADPTAHVYAEPVDGAKDVDLDRWPALTSPGVLAVRGVLDHPGHA